MSASALCAMTAWLACAGAALATPCDETAFRAERGLVYLEAESALFVDKDQAAAAAALDRLEAMDLNCHEADVAEKLRRAVEHDPSVVVALDIEPVSTGSGNHAVPVKQVVPKYPPDALAGWLEGDCEVYFDVSPMGVPENVRASCDNAVFIEAAEIAIAEARFAPKIVHGTAVERQAAIFPIVFRME